MLSILRDHLATFGLRVRYQRLVQERLLELAESPRPVADDSGEWQLLGGSKNSGTELSRASVRDRARRVVRENPHACNILRLLGAYVTGPGLQLNHQPVQKSEDFVEETAPVLSIADRIWKEFLTRNELHYSFREHSRRTWRDGECFVRMFACHDGPPRLRFVDPELVAAPASAPGSQGIVTAPHDVEVPVAFLILRPGSVDQAERVPAEAMLQTRIGVDSNEKRGVSLFAPLLDSIDGYEKWMETELLARKLQSSIVLWRKIQGSPQMADSVADQSASGGPGRGGRREKFAPGTILTTNHGTDIQFLQPNTNFSDAVPLGRMQLLGIAAGAGLPEFMLTADASNGNFASTMVAEGPAVKFFHSEQQFFAGEFTRVWRWVMEDAVQRRELPDDFFEQIEVSWSFPTLVNRDRAQERRADVQLVQAGVLSRAEVGRRDGVVPELMRSERRQEADVSPAGSDG